MIDRGSLPTMFSTIRQIGSAAGGADRADTLIATINSRLDRVKTAVAGRAPRKVLIIVGRQTGTLSDIIAVGHSARTSTRSPRSPAGATRCPRLSNRSTRAFLWKRSSACRPT